MPQCINVKAPEYQFLSKRAGIPEADLLEYCNYYIETYNRFPYLDELPGSNSEPYIRDVLKLDKNNSTKTENILKTTYSDTIEESVVKLNNEFKDKEISILPLEDKAIVRIKSRPVNHAIFDEVPINRNTNDMNPQIIISNTIDKLSKLYGIHVNEVNDAILSTEQWNHLMPRDRVVNAFVYNGEIYINTDRATEDSRIHEMLHLLIGSLRFNNPKLYKNLIDSCEKFKNYNNYIENEFSEKTRNDANEEIFVQELAKYLVGMESELNGIDANEILYNIHRVLDSMLMGTYSTRMLPNEQLFSSKLKDIAMFTNSDIFTNKSNRNPLQESSELHRRLNNFKADLKSNNYLEEICN